MICILYRHFGRFNLIFACVCHVRIMVFNATFNNCLAISWRAALLSKETGRPKEKHRPIAN